MFELERLFEGFYEGLFLKFYSRFNQRDSRLSSVDLPLPLVPTNAQEVPAGTVNDTPSRMGCPSRYPNATSRNSMSCPCGAGCSSVASALSCIENQFKVVLPIPSTKVNVQEPGVVARRRRLQLY